MVVTDLLLLSSNYCLLYKNESGPFISILLMPAGTTLDFVSRGCWRDIIARKGFASCFWWPPWAVALVLSSWGAKSSAYWAPGALLQCTVTSNTQKLVASPDSPPAVNGFPPLGWFHSGVLLARFFPITAWQFLVRFLYAP